MRLGWHQGWERRSLPLGAVDVVGRFMRPIVAAFASERERWFLWSPVFLGAGVAIYFGLGAEPSAWVGPTAAGFGAAAIVALRRSTTGFVIALALALAAIGFARAQLQTQLVAAPVLEKRMGPVTVSGRVVRIQTLTAGHRLLLDAVSVGSLSPDRTPARLRIRAMRPVSGLAPGDAVSVRAIVMPPPGPAAPGAFDFGRKAFFERIGGVGFTVGKVTRTARADAVGRSPSVLVSRLRQAATQRILAAVEPPAGAVAAALMTGERGAIPEEVLAAMRDSGLAHLLAISGLHMGLVAGLLFFALRLVLATVPTVALRYPIKKWAAAGAIVGAFCYLLISGATIPTQRAFVMTLIVLLAVLVDRNAISMRLVAWAAIAVLLVAPESLTSASFQLSFAAVVALVAFYEGLRPRMSVWRSEWRLSRRAAFYLATILMTTVVAGLATAPFAMASFNRLATYGVVANLFAVPLTGFWIMPWAILAFLLMPFGLEWLALAPMGWGIDAVIAVATTVASWPGSVQLVPAPPAAMVGVVAGGGLWLCLWRGRWRYLGAPVVLAGLALVGASRPPDLLVDGERRLMAVRLPTGQYALSSTGRRTFKAELWLRRAGNATAEAWPRYGADASGALACDTLGCLYRIGGRTVALARHRAALLEDCRPGVVVVSLVPVWRGQCRDPTHLIRPFELWRDGSYAIWLVGDEVRIRHVRAAIGERPWTFAGRRASRRPFRSAQ